MKHKIGLLLPYFVHEKNKTEREKVTSLQSQEEQTAPLAWNPGSLAADNLPFNTVMAGSMLVGGDSMSSLYLIISQISE